MKGGADTCEVRRLLMAAILAHAAKIATTKDPSMVLAAGTKFS